MTEANRIGPSELANKRLLFGHPARFIFAHFVYHLLTTIGLPRVQNTVLEKSFQNPIRSHCIQLVFAKQHMTLVRRLFVASTYKIYKKSDLEAGALLPKNNICN